VVSETFIIRQISGLMDLGHEVDIYARRPPEAYGPIHPEVERYCLLARTTYIDTDIPEASGYWEMPVWPLFGQTWLPGAEKPVPNAFRVLRAIPDLFRCLRAAPRLTFSVLDPREYGFQARSLSMMYRLSRLCSRPRHYEVVHAHFGPTGNIFRFARELWHAPLVVAFHGYDYSSWPRLHGNAVYRKLFDAADMVTVNSEYAQRQLEALGCAPAKLQRLNYGVGPEDFPFRERTRRTGEPVRLLSVGRLVEKKGFEYSIRAVARAVERHADLRYDIIGDGPLKPKLEALIRQLALESRVTLNGARDQMHVRKMMARGDIFILASVTAGDGDREGTPVSLLEAQASGLPVLSTRHSGIPEIVVDGGSGFLVPERDSEALADRLAYLLEHPEIWPEMGRNGRAHIERHYHVQELNHLLASLYGEAIARFGAAHGLGEGARGAAPRSA